MLPAFRSLGWLLLLAGCAPDGATWSPPGGAAGAGGTEAASGGAAAGGSAGAADAPGGGGAGAATAASGAGGGASDGGSDAGAAGSGAEVEPVGVFVAQGHAGRITRSCDDGRSFRDDQSSDAEYRCFSDDEHDCDHSAVAGRGLAFGSDSFVATWGWGAPGTLQRSLDGWIWSDVMTSTRTFADVAYGSGRFVAAGNPTYVSSDGVSWQMGGKLSFDFNYRGIEFVPAGGGTFIITGESQEKRAISRSSDGVTWTAASERPELCGQQLRGIAGSEDVVVLVSGAGHVCRSLDAGQSWQHQPVTERFTSPPVWTGEEFVVFENAKRWSSADGATWVSVPITPPSAAIGPLARSPGGTWVAANAGWKVWYEQQQLYRSSDEGKTWQPLEPGTFTGSHPIQFIAFGYVAPSSGCGLP